MTIVNKVSDFFGSFSDTFNYNLYQSSMGLTTLRYVLQLTALRDTQLVINHYSTSNTNLVEKSYS